jgi:hypothetical protein
MYVGGGCATLLLDVVWGIYLYEIQYFLNPASRWWYSYLPDLRYSFIIALLILVSFVIRNKKYSNTRFFDVPQTKWILLNLLIFAMISFWAVWPEMHYGSLKTYVKVIIFLGIAYKTIDTPSKIEKLIWIFLIGNFYLGWVGHFQGRAYGGRLDVFGPSDCGKDGNSVALILISSIPILIFYLINGKILQKIVSLLFMAFILDGIVLVNSRGGFLGLLTALVYITAIYVVLNKNVSFSRRLIMLGGIIAGVLLFLYMTDVTFWERMGSLKTEAHSEDGGGSRMLFWAKSIDLVNEYPLGVGTWGYQYLSPNFIPEHLLTGGRRAVHSLYFQCLAERGYLGTFIFIGLLFSNFNFLWKIKKYLKNRGELILYYQAVAIEAGFISFLVGSVFLNRLHAEVLYWFMMFIACFGNIHFIKNNINNK